MKAVLFREYGGPDVLEYTDVDVPSVGPNEVLIRTRATSANFNDIWARRGYPVKQPLPHISGSDAAGIVEAVGAEVRTVKAGDEVVVHPGQSCGVCAACARGESQFCRQFKIWGFDSGPLDGGHAEFVKVRESQVVRKPAGLSWAEAASLPLALETAWRMLVTRARVTAGQSVLIWGATGGLGSLAIQIVRLLGGSPVAVVSTGRKAEAAVRLGAEHVIVRTKQDVLAEVKRITQKQGVDVVFEHTGESTWPTSVQALRRGGSLVVCGATSGFNGLTDIRFLWNKQQSYLGSHLGTRAELEDALRFVAAGSIRPVVHDVLPLSEVAKGQSMQENAEIIGKLVYEVES